MRVGPSCPVAVSCACASAACACAACACAHSGFGAVVRVPVSPTGVSDYDKNSEIGSACFNSTTFTSSLGSNSL